MIFPQKEDSRSKAQNGLWALNKFETFFHWEKSGIFGLPISWEKLKSKFLFFFKKKEKKEEGKI